jgi:hypothetical protein
MAERGGEASGNGAAVATGATTTRATTAGGHNKVDMMGGHNKVDVMGGHNKVDMMGGAGGRVNGPDGRGVAGPFSRRVKGHVAAEGAHHGRDVGTDQPGTVAKPYGKCCGDGARGRVSHEMVEAGALGGQPGKVTKGSAVGDRGQGWVGPEVSSGSDVMRDQEHSQVTEPRCEGSRGGSDDGEEALKGLQAWQGRGGEGAYKG